MLPEQKVYTEVPLKEIELIGGTQGGPQKGNEEVFLTYIKFKMILDFQEEI